VVQHDNQLWCGQTNGSVRICDASEALWSLPGRIADLESYNGELCAISTDDLRCGERSWSTSVLNLHHPKFFKVGSELWLQDRRIVNQDESSKWFYVDFERGPEERLSPGRLSWPTDGGWLQVDGKSLVTKAGDIRIGQKLMLHSRPSDIYFQKGGRTLVINEGNSVFQHPSDCLSMAWMQSRHLCLGSDFVRDFDSGEIIFQGKKILRHASSDTGMVLIHPLGSVTTIDTSGVKASEIPSRHRVSAIGVSDNMSRLALGTRTGSVLIWDTQTESWIERQMYPDDVVSLSWVGPTLLVALMDEPFAILTDSEEHRGTTPATTLAGQGDEVAVARRFGGIQLLSTGRRCSKAVGVHQIVWLNSHLLIWSGETSGVWNTGGECRLFSVGEGHLNWLDNGRIIQSRKDLGG
jgi:hypothetical protein